MPYATCRCLDAAFAMPLRLPLRYAERRHSTCCVSQYEYVTYAADAAAIDAAAAILHAMLSLMSPMPLLSLITLAAMPLISPPCCYGCYVTLPIRRYATIRQTLAAATTPLLRLRQIDALRAIALDYAAIAAAISPPMRRFAFTLCRRRGAMICERQA